MYPKSPKNKRLGYLLSLILSGYGFHLTWESGRSWAELVNWSEDVGQKMAEATPLAGVETSEKTLQPGQPTNAANDDQKSKPSFVWHPYVITTFVISLGLFLFGLIGILKLPLREEIQSS